MRWQFYGWLKLVERCQEVKRFSSRETLA